MGTRWDFDSYELSQFSFILWKNLHKTESTDWILSVGFKNLKFVKKKKKKTFPYLKKAPDVVSLSIPSRIRKAAKILSKRMSQTEINGVEREI